MGKRIRKVSTELCAGCIYRARESAFQVFHCDYASIKRKCRLDPEGTCSHYKRDKNYDPIEAKRRAEAAREKRMAHKKREEAENKKTRGRPRKRR